MVVSPAGVLHAVHPVTRKTLWTFASGTEMGSVIRPRQGKESREINSSLDDDMGGESDERVMYKGPDGELYVVEGSQIGVSIRLSRHFSFSCFACWWVTGCDRVRNLCF